MERIELEKLIKKAFPDAPYLFYKDLSDKGDIEVEVYVKYGESIVISHIQRLKSFIFRLNKEHLFFVESDESDEDFIIKVLHQHQSFISEFDF